MSGGSHIRAVGPEAAPEAQTPSSIEAGDDTLALDESWEEDWAEADDAANQSRFSWVVPAIAATLATGWTAFFAWTFWEPMAGGGSPADWVIWIVNWSVPLVLIGLAYMIAMRNSRREANRFADTAAMLSREASELETRLLVVNRELSLAREFLGSQSRDLESFGRIAGERLSTHADHLQSLIHTNGEQVEAIASVSDTALSNMQKLRDDLPVIANSARDVTNQIGAAGRTSDDSLEKLIAGFQRLNEFGSASERQVAALSARVDGTVEQLGTRLAAIEQAADARFVALRAQSDEFRADLDSREVDTLAAMRERVERLRQGADELREQITDSEQAGFAAFQQTKDRLTEELTALNISLSALDEQAVGASAERLAALLKTADEFDEALTARAARLNERIARLQDAFDTREAQASEVLSQRLAELDDALDERREAQAVATQGLADRSESLIARIAELKTLFAGIEDQAAATEARLTGGLSDLSQRLENGRGELAETNGLLDRLTEASIRMLEIIQSASLQSREQLPQSIDRASESLSNIEERSALLRDAMDHTSQRGDDLSSYLIEARDHAQSIGTQFDAVSASLAQQTVDRMAQLDELKGRIAGIEADGQRVIGVSQDELASALTELVEKSRATFAEIERNAHDAITRSADRIGAMASDAIGSAIDEHGRSAVKELEEAASLATGKSRETAQQLRDQLAKVNELAGNLEQRVNRARELAEERVDNDFSRRMALITDSLNSNAIDIAKALSTDVTDTAWAAYLRGDRGIFTRRAVRLIDNGEAREIIDLYENDDEFREHVSRFIHDFEAMLRSVLSTRDGNALGVTVLGSDMGKLYVALAQAIERLRN